MTEEICKWLQDNYIENIKQCKFVLEKYSREYPYNVNDFLVGIFEIKKPNTEKELLENHLRLLGEMSYFGINPKVAGIKIREAIEESKFNYEVR